MWFVVVYMWFGANITGQRNTNAIKCVLQVLILSQTQPLGIKNVVLGGLEVVWGVSRDRKNKLSLKGCFMKNMKLFNILNKLQHRFNMADR